MICSEARLTANRLNAQKSTGPRTSEGKAISRQNGLKHGLTGQGIVTPEGDAEEIERRAEALADDMKPRSPAGLILIVQMATLSVRAERATEQESAAIARNVRHAADDHDEERIDRANQLFENLHEDPRNNLRKLKKMPEGVDRLIDAWRDFRADLAIDHKPLWTAGHLEQAGHMTGVKSEHARGTRLGALSRGFWGDFTVLSDSDGGNLSEDARKAWCKARLFERIDAEIAALEAHRETLDFEMIELDRAEAGSRALFDASKPAILARRYESEARGGFFKALKEFRQIESESEAKAESNPARPAMAQMGSSWGSPPPPAGEPYGAFPSFTSSEDQVVRGPEGQPLVYKPPVKTPG